MSNMIQCFVCKEEIESDSSYCDQCGSQVFVCSLCGRPGEKGKRCIMDGKEIVAAGMNPTSKIDDNPPPPNIPPQQPPVDPPQLPPQMPPAQPPYTPPQQPPVQQQSFSQPAAGSDRIKFSSQMYGIIFEAKDGDILGRSKGDFAGILGRFSYISGTHCKVLKTISGWSIQDLGSTNGTYYNGSRIPANAPVNLQSNSTVKLADLDLLVTFGASNAPADNQGTVRL